LACCEGVDFDLEIPWLALLDRDHQNRTGVNVSVLARHSLTGYKGSGNARTYALESAGGWRGSMLGLEKVMVAVALTGW